MSEIIYQKINLYSSTDYAQNKKFFDERKNLIEKILIENKLDYALEVIESYVTESSSRGLKKLYTLNLVIRKEDLNNVQVLLDTFYNYTYQITEEECIEQEDYEFEEEPIITDDMDDDIIKTNKSIFERKREFEDKIKQSSKLEKFIIIFFTLIFSFFVVFEIILIIETEYVWGILIIIVIEIIIYLKTLNDIVNKKGE